MYLQTYNPTDPFYTKEDLIQHAYTKRLNYTICFKENTHQELQQNVQQLPSTQERLHALLILRKERERVMSNCITQ